MAKHTPGPWKVMPDEAAKDYIRIRGTVLGGKYKIANALTPDLHGPDDAEARANARLIAAAPQMLEALKNVIEQHVADYGGCLKNEPDSCAFCAAREAIKLAEGEL